jgi:hypothetical protein
MYNSRLPTHLRPIKILHCLNAIMFAAIVLVMCSKECLAATSDWSRSSIIPPSPAKMAKELMERLQTGTFREERVPPRSLSGVQTTAARCA